MNLGNRPLPAQTFGLLVPSNTVMAFAWYGYLKALAGRPWPVAALCLLGAGCLSFTA